jgi:uncharacterized protein YdiU (UPF0061 family)
VVFAATNALEEILDDALLRPGRFDRKIFVGRPNLEEREALFGYYLGKVKYDPELEVARLARKAVHKTPAEIENVVKEAEIQADRLLELATKGSGQTPWSRQGDGRLTLKGGVREVLATALLEALGVPTSRSFSLVETGEALVRGDEPSPTRSAVLTRLSHSHIRFGTFQRQAYFDRPEQIRSLVDHVIAHYYPELETADDKAAALLAAVTARAGRLTARWMAAGFVHGVLNTDNMNITGESFDYGPYRFLPRNDPNFVAAYFDQSGLYAFGRQPEAVFWNLQQLGGSLTLVSDREGLIEALNGFAGAYRAELTAAMLARLGLKSRSADEDLEFVNAAFRALASEIGRAHV